MAYVTGTASSLAELLTAIQSGCTSNGWTLDSGVLSKGNCHTRLMVAGTELQVLGGIDSALGTPGPQSAWIGATWVPAPLVFPLTYHIHVLSAPDEVYVCCNFSVTRWQWLAFGCTPAAGLPGTGGWYGASSSEGGVANFVSLADDIAASGAWSVSGAFWAQNSSGGSMKGINCYVHAGYPGWSSATTADTEGQADAWNQAQPLIRRQPNAWNGEVSLLPITVMIRAAEAKRRLVAQIAHARYLRNDNLADGEIITLGADKWRAYPFVQKNAAVRNGGFGISHSGTLGWAIRYDGP